MSLPTGDAVFAVVDLARTAYVAPHRAGGGDGDRGTARHGKAASIAGGESRDAGEWSV